MKRVLVGGVALIAIGLIASAATVLVEGLDDSARSLTGDTSITPVRVVAVQPAVDAEDGDGAVRVVDPSLVVNKDGSTAVGASVENGTDSDVALTGVAVWVDRQPVPVNATQWWLPVLADDRSQVGAASDAGGFVMPSGITEGAVAEVAFRFDDGTCVLTEVTAVARTREHRSIYPKSNRSIGPVIDDDPPSRSEPCGDDGEG